MKLFSKAIAGAALLGLAQMAQSAAIVIDDFSVDQSMLVGGGTSATNTVAGGMLGGSRTITADATSGTGGFALIVTAGSSAPTPGTLDVSNNSTTAGVVTVTWDANGLGLGGVDLTSGGVYNSISIDVLSIDTTATVEFFLTDTLSVTGSLGPTSFNGMGTFNVLLSDFVSQGVDVTSIDSVSMVLNGQVGWDGAFDLIETGRVPSPATITLMGLSLLSLGLVSRRRS